MSRQVPLLRLTSRWKPIEIIADEVGERWRGGPHEPVGSHSVSQKKVCVAEELMSGKINQLAKDLADAWRSGGRRRCLLTGSINLSTPICPPPDADCHVRNFSPLT
jgi:hypothetical protein